MLHDEMKPDRIIVTGGAGFIGSALCRHLVACDKHVLNVDKLTYAATLQSLETIANNSHYRFLRADVADKHAMAAAFDDFQPDGVVHLAAETHVDRSIDNSEAFIETNICGTHTLLEAARRFFVCLNESLQAKFRFILVSTDEVYGSLRNDEPAFSEQSIYDPSSPYAASKAAADHLAQAWFRTYRFPVIISNCSNNFGPYQFPEKLIPLTIINALEGLPISVYGAGANIRDWLNVADHARALAEILQFGRVGEKYNIGARNERTNLHVVELICSILDDLVPDRAPHRSLITFVSDRPGHDLRYAINPEKIETELNWRPQNDFEADLRNTVTWFMQNRSWWQPLRQKVYSGGRLGLSQGHAVSAVR